MAGIDQKILDKLLFDTLNETYAVFVQILQMFLDETPKALAALQFAVDQEDGAEVAHLAHTLKSNALSLGAMELSRLCEDLELRGRAHQMEGLPELLKRLNREFDACEKELQEQLLAAQARAA